MSMVVCVCGYRCQNVWSSESGGNEVWINHEQKQNELCV